MTKFVVRCIFNGTKKDLRIPGNDARIVIEKAKRKEPNASCFIAYHRKFKGMPILTSINDINGYKDY